MKNETLAIIGAIELVYSGAYSGMTGDWRLAITAIAIVVMLVIFFKVDDKRKAARKQNNR